MITPIIEEALISGKAKFHSFMFALSAVGKLIIPSRKFIIITSIQIYPFSQVDTLFDIATDEKAVSKRSTYILDLLCGSDRNGFIFQNFFKGLNMPDPFLNGDLYIKNSEPVKFDTFLVCEQNVFISLLCQSGVVDANGGNFAPLTNTQLPTPPVSYGKSLNVQLYLEPSFNGTAYIPTSGEEAYGIPTASNPDETHQPFIKASANPNGSQLLEITPFANDYNFLYPLINISYISANKVDLKELLKNKILH